MNLLRKRFKTGKYDHVDSDKMDEGAVITAPILLEKANFFTKELGSNDNVCTN
jgi:hypothetical protein